MLSRCRPRRAGCRGRCACAAGCGAGEACCHNCGCRRGRHACCPLLQAPPWVPSMPFTPPTATALLLTAPGRPPLRRWAAPAGLPERRVRLPGHQHLHPGSHQAQALGPPAAGRRAAAPAGAQLPAVELVRRGAARRAGHAQQVGGWVGGMRCVCAGGEGGGGQAWDVGLGHAGLAK